MQQLVQYVTTTRDSRDVYMPDAYQLRTERGYVWLQKLAIYILRKLGCFAATKETTVLKHVFDTKGLAEALWRQRAEVFELYHMRGARLLVGYEDFERLTGIPMYKPFSFEVPYSAMEAGKPTVFDMQITVIPWMKGMLVLPKELA